MNDGPPPATSRWRSAGRWFVVWAILTTAIMIAGMLAGGLIWVVVGGLSRSSRDVPQLFRDGTGIGMQFTRVWAGGVSIVLCFVKAHEKFSFRAWLRRKFPSGK